MRWRDIQTLYGRELRSAMRERNIVVNSVLVPLLLYPGLLWASLTVAGFIAGRTESTRSRVAVVAVPGALAQALTEGEGIDLVDLPDDADAVLRAGELDAIVRYVPDEESYFKVTIQYDSTRERGRIAEARLDDLVRAYRRAWLAEQGQAVGLGEAALQPFWIEHENLSSKREMGAFLLSMMLPLLIVVSVAMGAFYPAIDTTAGERERHTWETLITTGTDWRHIVVAKYLYVATVAAVAGALNFVSMAVTMRGALRSLAGGRVEVTLPFAAVPVILGGVLVLALLFAAAMMLLAVFARTFKEGQSFVSPFLVVMLVPLMLLQVPGLHLTLGFAAVPVVNIALMFRDAITGTTEWPLVGVSLLAVAACVWAALFLAARVLALEHLRVDGLPGGLRALLRRRPR